MEKNLSSLVQETSRVTEGSPTEGERRRKGELFEKIGQEERVARTRSQEGGFEVGENRRLCERVEWEGRVAGGSLKVGENMRQL